MYKLHPNTIGFGNCYKNEHQRVNDLRTTIILLNLKVGMVKKGNVGDNVKSKFVIDQKELERRGQKLFSLKFHREAINDCRE